MKLFVAFVLGFIVRDAGITFTDMAHFADRGVESAKSVVKDTVNQ